MGWTCSWRRVSTLESAWKTTVVSGAALAYTLATVSQIEQDILERLTVESTATANAPLSAPHEALIDEVRLLLLDAPSVAWPAWAPNGRNCPPIRAPVTNGRPNPWWSCHAARCARAAPSISAVGTGRAAPACRHQPKRPIPARAARCGQNAALTLGVLYARLRLVDPALAEIRQSRGLAGLAGAATRLPSKPG